jgi:hypothetical protein
MLKIDGRITKQLPYSPNKTLKEYLDETGFDLTDCRVIVTGSVVTDLSATLLDIDEVIVTPKVEVWAGLFGLSVFWANVINLTLAIASIVFSLFQASSKPKAPSFGTIGEGLDESSPTYGWEGIVNTQDIGTPIGIVYGEHRVGGNIINQFVRTDGDKEYLNLLLSLSEGEIDSIDSIEINENPSANFAGITLSKRYGTNTQAQVANFNDSHDLHNLNVNLMKNSAYVYSTVNADITCFEIHFSLVGGLYQSSGSDIVSWAVTYLVEYSIHNANSYTSLGSTTIDAKSRSDLHRIFRKEGLTAGEYDIRITRTSDDSQLSPLKQGDLYLKSVDEIVQDEPLIYPNLALLGIEALATDQLSGGTPTVTSLVRGRKVNIPDVRVALGGAVVAWDDYYYDPVNTVFKLFADDSALYWDGSTCVNAFSANPIWCLRDLITNTRYGLGDYITTANLDLTEILEMALFCEEKVSDGENGYEKRFRMDVVIDSSTRAIDLLSQLCATFRCYIFYSNGAIKFKIDKAENPVQLFGMGNIVAESFIQSWKSIKEIPNVIEIQFMNKDLNYKQDLISVINEASITAGNPLRKKTIRLFCTRITQALREGHYVLNLGTAIQRTISLKAGIDAIVCQAGDVINVSHDVPQWGFSGRVIAGSGQATIKLDQSVTLLGSPKTYQVMCQHIANDTIEIRTVSDGAGTYSTLGVTVNWTLTPSAFDKYSFGETNKVTAPYRIVNMKRAENSEVEIVALEYDADVYDTDVIALPDNNYSALSTTIPIITGLILSQISDGSAIEVWFAKPDDSAYQNKYSYAKIYLSDNAGASYTLVGQTAGTFFSIAGTYINNATYRVKVLTVCTNGLEDKLSNAPSADIVMNVSGTAPANVSSFSYTWGDLLLLTWSANLEANLVGYEIRDENTNFGVDDVHLIYRGLTNRYTMLPATRTVGTFYIRAYNDGGLYSVASTSITPTNAVPSIPTGLNADVMFNVARAYWTNVSDSDLVNYQVYISQTNAWGGEETLLGEVAGTSITFNSKPPYGGTAQSATDTTLVDNTLIGLGDGYFTGDTIVITEGIGVGQTRAIIDFTDADGGITVAEWDTNPDATSKYMITDNCWIKVRAVDRYGVGTFTSAHEVSFDNIDESMIGDNIITARKIYVACLSAISANMGCLTSGTITGGTIQTATGGARTIFNETGIYSYDSNCCLNFSVVDGDICATSIKLVNQNDPSCYSYLCDGALMFHDCLGDVPYLKRICTGQSNTGSTVCLCGWTTPPCVLVSIKSVMSYNASYPTQCQKWDIYSTAPEYYCNCATDYGYCFVVHGALTTFEGQGAECVKNVAFGACTLTEACACMTCVHMRFQLWCNNSAPSNYYYGVICYALCYRKSGDTTWCAYCFGYTQPHASTGEIKSTTDAYNNIQFPCMATWQIMACQVSLCYVDSGICATTTIYCCYECVRCASAQCLCRDYVYLTTCNCGFCWDSHIICAAFSGSAPSCIYCIAVSACVIACIDANSVVLSTPGSGAVETCINDFLCFPTNTAMNTTLCNFCNCYVNCNNCCTNKVYDLCNTVVACYTTACSPDYVCWCTCMGRRQTYWQYFYGTTIQYNTCLTNICQTIYWCEICYTGAAGCCISTTQYALCNSYGCFCTLDPTGVLNWLAIAYS